jgi:hypothetical protein
VHPALAAGRAGGRAGAGAAAMITPVAMNDRGAEAKDMQGMFDRFGRIERAAIGAAG